MNTTEPEFPRPLVGTHLIVRQSKTRYRAEELIPVRVRKIARFKIELEDLDGKDLPWMFRTFDLRNQHQWGSYKSDFPERHRSYKLHTPETLVWAKRKEEADKYLSEQRIRLYEMSDSLGEAAKADPVGFVNVLRKFEGLEEI